MASRKLPRDAKISDIIDSLSDPVEYVRGALENMLFFQKTHGSVRVRIGVMGQGQVPHYRLEPEGDLEEYVSDFIEGDEALARHYVAFHGKNHKRQPWGIEELRGTHWSEQGMQLEEIKSLLGQLRERRRR